jgi:hypothetical protein
MMTFWLGIVHMTIGSLSKRFTLHPILTGLCCKGDRLVPCQKLVVEKNSIYSTLFERFHDALEG